MPAPEPQSSQPPRPGAGSSTGGRPDPLEMALRDTEERLRGILHTAVEAIITIDEHGIIDSVNPAALKLFGYGHPREMLGRSVNILMPEPYASHHDGFISAYRRTGVGRIIGIGREVVGLRKDGSLFPMDLSVGELRLSGRRFFTGILRDITERKRLEKEVLEISDREQRRIGNDLHDDLCQHLTGVSLLSELLAQKLCASSPAEAADATRIADRIRAAIEKTRLLARGISPMDPDSADAAAALAELASSAAALFSIHCRLHAPEPVSITDAAVATHLYRIAQEAISNAVRHGRATRVDLCLQLAEGEFLLSISDNGAGFPAPGAADPSPDGSSGMGLRIMKYRAGMIGGVLETANSPGGGATVTCRFRPLSAQA